VVVHTPRQAAVTHLEATEATSYTLRELEKVSSHHMVSCAITFGPMLPDRRLR
jgi:hypothetical protein